VKTFPTYYQEYFLSLDVKLIAAVNTWTNIIHVTKGGNEEYGDRIPTILILPGTRKPVICASIGTNKNHCFTAKENLPIHKFTHIQISQEFRHKTNDYWFVVYIEEKLVHQIKNTKPVVFDSVKVYMSDPWYMSANALLKNVKIRTSQKG